MPRDKRERHGVVCAVLPRCEHCGSERGWTVRALLHLEKRERGEAFCEGRMSAEQLSAVLGTAAGFCTTVSFGPQIFKIVKQGGRDVSYGMLTLFLVGVLLWFGYGLVVKAQAVIITNLATAVLIAIAMGLKAWTAKRDFGKSVMGI